MPITHIKNEINPADPQRIALDTTKTSFRGKAFSNSMMLENNQPAKPAMRMTDQSSRDIMNLFP